jgi:hypothetical protein
MKSHENKSCNVIMNITILKWCEYSQIRSSFQNAHLFLLILDYPSQHSEIKTFSLRRLLLQGTSTFLGRFPELNRMFAAKLCLPSGNLLNHELASCRVLARCEGVDGT